MTTLTSQQRRRAREAQLLEVLSLLQQQERGSHPMAIENHQLVARFLKFRLTSTFKPTEDPQGKVIGFVVSTGVYTPDGQVINSDTFLSGMQQSPGLWKALSALLQRLHLCNYFLHELARQQTLHLSLLSQEDARVAQQMLALLELPATQIQLQPPESLSRRIRHNLITGVVISPLFPPPRTRQTDQRRTALAKPPPPVHSHCGHLS